MDYLNRSFPRAFAGYLIMRPSRQRSMLYVDIVTPCVAFVLTARHHWLSSPSRQSQADSPLGPPELLAQTAVWLIILIGILAFGVLAYLGHRWRLRYLKAGQRKLEQLIAERTEQLRLSDAKNKAILQALPDAIFRLGSDGTYLEFYSGSDFRSLVPPQEFLGKRITEVLPPALAQSVQEYVNRAHQTREAQSFQYELSLDGNLGCFEAHVVAWEHGESLAVVRDITARKQTEKTLRDLESFRLIAEASPIAIGISRLPDGMMLYANHHVEQILGIPNQELIGRAAPSVTAPSKRMLSPARLASVALVTRGMRPVKFAASRHGTSTLRTYPASIDSGRASRPSAPGAYPS